MIERQVMDRDNPSQAGQAADERRQIVKSPGHANLQGRLDVQGPRLVIPKFDVLQHQAIGGTQAANILKQAGHLGISRQLPQQVGETASHRFEFPGLGLQAGRLAGFQRDLLFKRHFLRLKLAQLLPRPAQVEGVAHYPQQAKNRATQ